MTDVFHCDSIRAECFEEYIKGPFGYKWAYFIWGRIDRGKIYTIVLLAWEVSHTVMKKTP